ncbi:MAG: hypothetical protein KJ574_04370 [Nanoarchaeota archaeon]|nr:hypothetical protein [Nanoarchaeota archaeon]
MNNLDSFVEQFTDKKTENIIKIGSAFFQVDEAQRAIIEKIRTNAKREPRYAGTFLGEEKNGKFKPSIALLDMIAESTDSKVTVDSKAEWLFLCKRDIFGSSIKKANVKKGLVIVQNEQGEPLGYGEMTGEISNSDKIAVKNILDKGNFLRRER